MSNARPQSSEIPETSGSKAPVMSEHKESPRKPPIAKLRKILPIPAVKGHGIDEEEEAENSDSDDDDGEPARDGPSIIRPSALGLNHIRTRSDASLLRFSTSDGRPSNLGIVANKAKGGAGFRPKPSVDHQHATSTEGKKMHWNQSKSLRIPSHVTPGVEGNNTAFAKEMQSPRFQAILRLTSGRNKRAPEIKSFSHELNSKGVRPLPFWKSRAVGRMEHIMVMIRAKFDKSKEEVNADLGVFAGDLVGILEKTSESHPEWKESLEDLLVIARLCEKMSCNEFWLKCEGIVQHLDDRRQELPMGTIKQAHTRLLFVLTRCSRLVQFHKESGYEEDHIIPSHQLSDLGFYPEQVFVGGHKEDHVDESVPNTQEENAKQNKGGVFEAEEVSTAKSVASSAGSYRMSSWKKLPSAAEKNRKGHDSVDTPSKDKDDVTRVESNIESNVHADHPDTTLKIQRITKDVHGDQQIVTYENSLICRICEVEIPTVHVEQHSGICTIADRCDLKGLTINERFERIAGTLGKILESWTPKSTDTASGTPEVVRVSPSSMPEELDELSPKHNVLSSHCSEDVLDCLPEADSPVLAKNGSSAGSLTPRSPLLTPRMSQIEFLLSGQRTMSESESYQQINRLLDIARAVASVNSNDYSSLEYMLDRLEDLKYAIQDRKVDALVVETFGRRIEKLLQEKYVLLCGQIEDEKLEPSNSVVEEDSSIEDDIVRSLRASPINPCSKDRTSIEDFEIIKPISRGAFGRVFLAKKRATGDLFAIKVLKKADMIRKNAVESILAERNILISLRNPFVVRFFYSFTCRENLYLVMEYLNGGDLFSLLRNLGCLEEDMARIYIAELVLALEYLHSLNVIHRDLKPDNLLIGPDGHIKLTDFGLSKVGLINSTDDLSGPSVTRSTILGDDKPKMAAHSSEKRGQRQKHSVVGTPDYLAPEILLGMGHGATADWWSVGVILFEILVGIPPFNAENPQKIFDNIMNRDIVWPKVPEEMGYEAYDIINKLLIENPVQRLGATGAREVKRHPFFKDINWDTLARQKAMFIPSPEAHDTSYFMSRYIWNPEDESVCGGSDFDDMCETDSVSCSSSPFSNILDEDGDECGTLADFGAPTLNVKYSFSNFSFKNLSQLASINYDLVVKSAQESLQASKPSIP